MADPARYVVRTMQLDDGTMQTMRSMVGLALVISVTACKHDVGTTHVTSGEMEASSARIAAAERERDEAVRAAEAARRSAFAERERRDALAAELSAQRELDQFVRQAWNRLDYLDAEIHALGTRVTRLTGTRRAKLERALAALRRTRDALDEDIRRLPDAANRDWTTVASAIRAKFDDAERAVVDSAWSSEP